ncbi:MAG TPA: metalloregulator ArsR/SmtB family transcription factor [Actinomycetota bacterium]|nr:metalloregulator ArsR/SmtB family transcription factor [Actinomycetota bacterium]
MEAVLKAIAEPRRREILRLVWDRELAAGEIASRFDVTHAAISQHLRVLREANLVRERRDGNRRLYRAAPEGLGDLKAFLESYWDAGLQRLKVEAERDERRKRARNRAANRRRRP